ncbi:MAG: ABC transporter substrate-binding protein [Egibacteraceae bacterium]
MTPSRLRVTLAAALIALIAMLGPASATEAIAQDLVVALSSEPTSLSPLFLDVDTGNWKAFNGLVTFDADLGLVPDLAAELPEVSEDGKTVTVRLRDDVQFHDGEPLTADDVVFTWQALSDPELASPLFSRFGLDGLISEVTAVDDLTVQFTLSRLDPAFVEKLYVGIVPEHLLAGEDLAQSDFNRQPVGTGPYRYVETVPGERIVFEANPDYFGGAPTIQRVVFTFLPDENARVAALLDGSIDVARLNPRLAETFRDNPAFQVIEIPSASIEQMSLPNTNPVLAEAPVRRAIAMGIDRQALLEAIQLGVGQVANSPIVSGQWAYDPSVTIPFDPEQAAQLLDEAGWVPGDDGIREKDGQRLAFTIMHLPTLTQHRDMGLAMRSDLAEIGIDVTVEAVDTPAYLDRLATDPWLHGIGTPYDPDTELWARYHSSLADDGDPGTNRAGMRNPDVDAALEAGRATTDRDQRRDSYTDLQHALAEDGSYLHLLERAITVVVPADVEGIEVQLQGSPHGFPRGIAWSLERWTRT